LEACEISVEDAQKLPSDSISANELIPLQVDIKLINKNDSAVVITFAP
jgi:hypothetical protein